MLVQLDDFVSTYQLPGGRATYCLKQTEAAARKTDVGAIVTYAEQALAQAEATRRAELRFRQAKQTPLYGANAVAADNGVDRSTSGFFGALSAWLALPKGVDDARVAGAQRLLDELFPRGVAAITNLSFVEEHESVLDLLSRLQGGGDLAPFVAQLNLQPFVTSLAGANAKLGDELRKAPASEAPTWDVVRSERSALQRALQKLVVVVLGHYSGDDDASVAARSELLGPILEQQRAASALYKSRRGVRDIDPDTGIEDEQPIEA